MTPLLKEGIALVCVIAVAIAAVVAMSQPAKPGNPYDTFTARVNKVPVQILAPTAGQLLTLPEAEGGQVRQGDVLATIQVLDGNFRPPTDSKLLLLKGDIVSIFSPVSGIVAKVALAPLSMVGGSALMLQLFTVDSTDLQVLMPDANKIAAYRAFYAGLQPGPRRVAIRIEGLLPVDLAGSAGIHTNVYRALCQGGSQCASLLTQLQVPVYALRVRT